ncbi:MAG TPA: hypothetical protein VNA16_03810, partial [Abditibacteriaceae bacterium]|nr:hypothetical protein [Abditibacteriaceae bacterium]
VEMQIPLSVMGAHTFRFNALRRVYDARADMRYIVRAYPDAGDVMLMPIVKLESDVLKRDQHGK